MRPLLRAAILALGLAAPAIHAQPAPWTDPSPHQTRAVAVAPDVRLEVLDWGGSGPALVFLAGLGNTGHVFDDFAPRFRDAYRVIAITRRGFGASSLPADGYDAATRARDVVTVLDSLRVDRAIVAGHSIAGDELSKLAAAHPERLRALVYLDAYDYVPGPPDPRRAGLRRPPLPPMTAADSASLDAARAWHRRAFGFVPPDAELRDRFTVAADGRLAPSRPRPNGAGRVNAGAERVDYARVTVPALAIYNVADSAAQYFPGFAEYDADTRAEAERFLKPLAEWARDVRDRFRAGAPRGTVVELPGAGHYLFITRAERVEREMRDFLSRIR